RTAARTAGVAIEGAVGDRKQRQPRRIDDAAIAHCRIGTEGAIVNEDRTSSNGEDGPTVAAGVVIGKNAIVESQRVRAVGNRAASTTLTILKRQVRDTDGDAA